VFTGGRKEKAQQLSPAHYWGARKKHNNSFHPRIIGGRKVKAQLLAPAYYISTEFYDPRVVIIH